MKKIKYYQVEYNATELYYNIERKAFSIFNQSLLSAINY